MTSGPAQGSGPEPSPEASVIRALDELLRGRLPGPLPGGGASGLVDGINKLIAFMGEIQEFIIPLAKGELSSLPPRSGNFMASPFKELHSRLCELTWQAQQVARGDYSQRIAFMGDFSQAFNSMVQALETKDRELNATIHRLDQLVSTALDAIHVVDLDGRLRIWNPAFLSHLGYTAEEAPGLVVEDWDRRWNRAELRVMIRSLLAEPRTFESLHQRKDGTLLNVEISATGIIMDGQEMLFAAARDVTDRKRAEASEARAMKAESLVLMAGSIAHDFNNLFGALLASMELVEMQSKGNPGVLQSVATGKEVLRRAINLSWKMNDFSGRAISRRELLDLPTLVTRWTGTPAPARLDLDLDLAMGMALPRIKADPERLRKVFEGILENAWEAMDEAGLPEGRVQVRVFRSFPGGPDGKTGLWAEEPPMEGGSVCLEVANDGPCPTPEVMALMFDPFYTTKALGRGLGLASALGVLQAHGAGIHLLPGTAGGLRFRIHFPPAEA